MEPVYDLTCLCIAVASMVMALGMLLMQIEPVHRTCRYLYAAVLAVALIGMQLSEPVWGRVGRFRRGARR